HPAARPPRRTGGRAAGRRARTGRRRRPARAGDALVGSVPGRLRLLLAGFVGGGRAALAAITAAGHDVLPGPPRAARTDVLRESAAVLRRARRKG
ncbi:squalene synthase HpnC, partial [Streptomyces zhihengii]